MKKSEKVAFLEKVKGQYKLGRYFCKFNDYPEYYYILDFSDKFFLGIKEEDFILNGFKIRRINDLKNIELVANLCATINEEREVLKDVIKPNVDLINWKTIFNSLQALNKFIIVEYESLDEEECEFIIGKIDSITNSTLFFKGFSTKGIWYEHCIEIPYQWITSITFGDRYSVVWEEYMRKHHMLDI